MELYPTLSRNRNLPKGVLHIAEAETMSGEIIYSYFIDAGGRVQVVTDWVGDKPHAVALAAVCRITGLRGEDILTRWQEWIDYVAEATWEGRVS